MEKLQKSTIKSRNHVLRLLNKHGCKLVSPLSEYTSEMSVIEYTTSCGHGTKRMMAKLIIRQSQKNDTAFLCRKCALEARGIAGRRETRIKNFLNKHGCKFIRTIHKTNGVNSLYRVRYVEYVAKCGHIIQNRDCNIYHGSATWVCTSCVKLRRSEEGKHRLEEACNRLGCKLIKYSTVHNKASGGKSTFRGKCGHTFKMCAKSFYKRDSGYCPRCASKFNSEKHVLDAMTKLFGIKSVVRHFPIMSGKSYQFIDVAIPAVRLAVEYNGVQHYNFCEFFYKSKDKFDDAKNRDDRKRKWCKDNGYTLVEIDGRVKENQLAKLTTERVALELEKQTGHSVEYFKKILEDGNGKSKKNNS